METEIGKDMEIPTRIIKDLEGMSQVFIENLLYLCGGPIGMNKDYDTSQIFKIDTNAIPISVSVEVTSLFAHHYPALGVFRNDYIVVIGGKNNKKCEIYNRISKKRRSYQICRKKGISRM